MIVVDLAAVSMSRPDRPLLQDVSLTISTGDRIGVVGINGTGKSTLLRLVAGISQPESGVIRRSPGATISLLDQGGDLPDTTALAAVGVGWEAEAALSRLGLGELFDRPVTQLSGGQRKRVALARALLSPADLLILDEPTNHLDVDGIEWLESQMARYRGALLLVTHDRHVLDKVTNRMVELDRGRAYVHQGGYASYLDARELRATQSARAEDVRRNLARRELAWLQRGAPARTRKPKARIAAATQTVQGRGPAAARASQLDLHVAATPRLGDTVIELRGVHAGHTSDGTFREVLAGVDLALDPDERLGVIGLNGAGKSTLLDVLAGRLTPTGGQVVTGPTVQLGYWDQLGEDLDPNLRAVDIVAGPARRPDWSDEAFLERFWFDKDNAWAPVGTLSGGERRRLQLVATLARRPNVLLLDEPTNDLDLDTLRVLEDFLEEWPGALVVVSHDRAFLERTVTDVIIVDGEGRAERRAGGLAGWLADRAKASAPPAPSGPAKAFSKASSKASSKPSAPKASPKTAAAGAGAASASTLRHRLRDTEKEIAQLTKKRDALAPQLEAAGVASDREALARVGTELAELSGRIEALEERWLELAAEAESG